MIIVIATGNDMFADIVNLVGDCGAPDVKHHLETAPANAKYTSSR